MKPVILVTGFASGADGGPDPSGVLLPLLRAGSQEHADVRTLLLPADPERALVKAIEAMDRLLPDAVISLGAAAGDAVISVERIATNHELAPPGGAGRVDPIDAAGPAAYFSTLPVHAMVERMRSGSVPAVLSDRAEASLCNRLLYALLHYVALRGQETWFKKRPPAGLVSRVGLVRVPRPAQHDPSSRARATPADLRTSLKGVSLAIEAVVDVLAAVEADPIELSPADE